MSCFLFGGGAGLWDGGRSILQGKKRLLSREQEKRFCCFDVPKDLIVFVTNCQYNHTDHPQELPRALRLTPIRIVNGNKLPPSILSLFQANPRVRVQILRVQLGYLLGSGCKPSPGRCLCRGCEVPGSDNRAGNASPSLAFLWEWILSARNSPATPPQEESEPSSWPCSARQGHLSLTLTKDQLLAQSTGIGSHDNPSLETVSAHSVHMHRCV